MFHVRFRNVVALTVVLACAMSFAVNDASAQDSLRLIRSIKLPHATSRLDHMTLDPKRQRLFISALGAFTMDVIDLQRGTVVHRIEQLNQPQQPVYIPSMDTVVVSCSGSGTCQFFNAETFNLTQTAAARPGADDLRYHEPTGRLYLAYSNGVCAIDAKTGKMLNDVKIQEHPEAFEIEATGQRMFVNLPLASVVVVVNCETMEEIARWPLGDSHGNTAMALDEANHRLFLATRGYSQLLVLNTDTGTVITTLRMMDHCDDLFYDATSRRIFASCGAGTIDVFEQKDADTYALADRVPTSPGAGTSLLAPHLRRLFVAVPAQALEDAELREYEVFTPASAPTQPPATQPAGGKETQSGTE